MVAMTPASKPLGGEACAASSGSEDVSARCPLERSDEPSASVLREAIASLPESLAGAVHRAFFRENPTSGPGEGRQDAAASEHEAGLRLEALRRLRGELDGRCDPAWERLEDPAMARIAPRRHSYATHRAEAASEIGQ